MNRTRALSDEFALVLVTDRRIRPDRAVADTVRAALDAGLRAVQLREKDLPAGERLRLAEDLRKLTSDAGARLLINDRVDVALAVGADGVQLPSGGLSPEAARAMLGGEAVIGASVHSIAEAEKAEGRGADFVLLAPIFDPFSKAGGAPPLGLATVAAASGRLSVPVIALGGIDTGRAGEAIRAGAFGVAVVSAIGAADDPGAATRRLLEDVFNSRRC